MYQSIEFKEMDSGVIYSHRIGQPAYVMAARIVHFFAFE